ncbi:MAG TPA: hypothetical protein VEW95_09335 [Candidatus Limnocylindrales bacterium]|nr:hypothetical protein [Candidatus Limnocylindrales bacterium]
MPILDLQKRLRELGRIRTGEKVAGSNGPRPSKLDRFRLTSGSQTLIEAAAEAYGSDKRGVRPWTNPFDNSQEYEVVVAAETLRIVVPPGQSLSQWWEMWTGGGCARRCDGERESITDKPCLCPPVGKERAEAAAKGRACKPTTRVSVILPDLPDIGTWRLESHGFNAAVELAGMADILEGATRQGRMIPAKMRLDQRTVKRQGEATRNFAVPVIEVDHAAARMLLAAAEDGEALALPGGLIPPQLGTSAPMPVDTAIKPATAVEDPPAGAEATKPRGARTRSSRAAPAADSANGQGNAPAPAPACGHPPAKHEVRDSGVWCTDCGEQIAERAAAPARSRARKKQGDPGYWSDRVHAVSGERGIDSDAELRLVAAAMLGADPATLALPDDDPARFSKKNLVDGQWELVDGLLRALPTRGKDLDADLDAIGRWVYPQATAKGITDWGDINVLAGAATGHADADDLSVAEWVAFSIRLSAGEYDAAPQLATAGAAS